VFERRILRKIFGRKETMKENTKYETTNILKNYITNLALLEH